MEEGQRPKLVGRDDEIGRLVDALARTAGGKGDVFLIEGETGIGKTRLVQEAQAVAESTGFKVLTAACMHGSNTPYLSFQEALRSGGMEYLFSEESPRVEAAYVVTRTGLPVKDVLRQKTALDPDIFASMLSAVGNFVKEAMSLMAGKSEEGSLNSLGFGEYRILIESGPEVNLVVILAGKENEFLIEDMRGALAKVRAGYGAILADWDGDMRRVEGIEEAIQPLVFSGKFDGPHAGLDDPKARRNLLFENVALGLGRYAQRQPVLLCLEDLHWADHSTFALLQYVARTARQHRILIVGTFQPEEVGGDSLAEGIQLMGREMRTGRIELERLPREVTHELLQSAFGRITLGSRFEERLYSRTEGNPLYLIELVRMMIDEGSITSAGGVWRISSEMREITIPARIHDVVTRRLDRLTRGERRTLDVAAVIGSVFSSKVLARALGVERVALLEELRDIEGAHKLVRPAGEEWRFDQGMVREVLYEGMPSELRMEYHSLVAQSIESYHREDMMAVVGSLALHYYRSSMKDKALPYLVMAADAARKSFSNKEAVTLYKEALQLEPKPERRIDLLERIGDIHELTGEYAASLDAYEKAIAIAQNPLKKGELKAKKGKVLNRKGERSESMKVNAEALELVDGTGTEAEALALNNIGVALWGRGEAEKATEMFQKVLTIRTALGDQRGMAAAVLNIGIVEIEKGLYDDAVKHLTESLTNFDKAGDLGNVALVYNSLGNVYVFKGEPSKALHWYTRGMRMRERIGDQRGIAYSLGNIGLLSLGRGDHEKALQCFQRALRIGDGISDQRVVAYSLSSIGLVHCDRGEMEKAVECMERALSVSSNIGDQSGMALAMNNLGFVHTASGDCSKALTYLERGRAMREKIGDKALVSETCCRIAEAYLRAGDLDKALEYAETALKLSEEVGAKEYRALAQTMLGMVHRERKNWEAAAQNFEDSLKYFEDAGLGTQLYLTRSEYGLMWKEKGDLGKAEEHLRTAVDSLRRLRIRRGLDTAESALAGLEGGHAESS